jgi:uncharacterized membrane protein YfcA
VVTIIGIGLLAGFLIGSVGIGGVIIVPALTYIYGTNIQIAIAAAIMSFAVSGAVGTYRYGKKGFIRWSDVGALSLATIPATILGALATHVASPLLLKGAVGILSLAAGLHAIFAKKAANPEDAPSLPSWSLASIGAVIGFGSAVTGTGGPLMLVPTLIWLGQPVLTTIGLSQVIQLPISIVATVTNTVAGAMDFKLAIILCAALAVGSWFGASLAHSVPTASLRKGVAILLVFVGVAVILDVGSAWMATAA